MLISPEVCVLRVELAQVIARLVEATGYIRALEIIDRECRLVKIGPRAQPRFPRGRPT